MTAYLIAGTISACTLLVIYCVATAPWGWEDEDGFHEGKKDD